MTLIATPLPAHTPAAKPRVLLADDSRVVRMAIKKILGTDYELIEVVDGAGAWERLGADAEIQALVTDIEMPNVDGYELICRIRGAEENRLRMLPVIAITGAEDEETKQRAFACGATDFIMKPIDAIQLRARVQAYVRYDQSTRELVEKTAVLEDQAIVDLMTGLNSRRYLIQRGEQDLAFAKRRGNDLSLIRVDIDQFKKLYKAHGDDISEALLTWFAKLLLDSARTEDTVARVGGAQFAILASATGIKAATALCRRLREAVASQPYRQGGLTIPVTLSMGMSNLAQDRRDDIEELLTLAHQRLCHAQSEGGDRVCSSILTDMPAVEEVVVPALEPPAEMLPTLPEAVAEPAAADTLSVPELEAMLSLEAEFASSQIGEPETLLPFMESVPPDSPALMTADPAPLSADDAPGIDQALQLLAQGQTDALVPFLDTLLRKLQPLIDFAAQIRNRNTAQLGDEKL